MIDIWRDNDNNVFGLIREKVSWDKRTGLLVEYPVIQISHSIKQSLSITPPIVIKVNYPFNDLGLLDFTRPTVSASLFLPQGWDFEPLPNVGQLSGEEGR